MQFLNKIIVTITLISAVLFLSACEAQRQQKIAETRSFAAKRNSSPSYIDGFEHGCQSVGNTAQFSKNTNRYINDKHYSTGWDDGYMHCEKRDKEVRQAFEGTSKMFGTIGAMGQ